MPAEAAHIENNGRLQQQWLDWLERDLGNLRAMLNWAWTHGEIAITARLGVALHQFWRWHSRLVDGRPRLERVHAQSAALSPALRAKVLDATGILTASQGKYKQAKGLYTQSVAALRTLGDATGTAPGTQRRGRNTERVKLGITRVSIVADWAVCFLK